MEIFKRYDIRGSYPEEIDEEIAFKLGKAAGSLCRKNFERNWIVIGRDSRNTSFSLKRNFVYGILKTGVNAIDIGLAPSDMVAFAGNHFNSGFSVSITASHLDWDWNGFKFRYRDGNGFLNEDLEKLKKRYYNSEGKFQKEGKHIERKNFKRVYINYLYKNFKKFFSKIKGKVVVDTVNGPSSLIFPRLVEILGGEVISINGNLEERGREPEPKEENLKELKEKVLEEGALMGLAHDVDADRLSVIDGKGNFIQSDKLICVFSKLIGNPIVVSIDVSKSVTEIVDEVHFSKVGDPFVSKTVLDKNANFGAEPSGQFIDPEFIPHASGSLFGLLTAGFGKKLEKEVEKIPKYEMVKANLKVKNRKERMKRFEEFAEKNGKLISKLDGVKFDYRNCHILARTSGTEDVLRINVENEIEGKAREVLEELKEFCI